MTDAPVQLSSSGPPETILEPEPAEALDALAAAVSSADAVEAISRVCEQWPRMLVAWAELGDRTPNPALAYAAYRVGYHRGLDRLRASGWRGSGYVRWQHRTNLGFLRSLDGLRRVATKIGEADEAERTTIFLHQLDPSWAPDPS